MNTLTLQLDHSELIYLLWLMKALSIPGIESKSLDDGSSDQVIADLTNARRSLQARRLIAVEENDIQIDQHAMNLVGTCALAKASLMLECQTKESTAQFLSFYFRPEAWVRHSILITGRHNFSLVESPLRDFSRLVGETLPQYTRYTPAEFVLPKAMVDLVLAFFSSERLLEVNHVFQDPDLPIDLARALIDTLNNLQQKITIDVSFHNRAEDQADHSVLLIRNPQGYWHVDSLNGNGSVKLTSVSQQEAINLFNQLVEQAQVH